MNRVESVHRATAPVCEMIEFERGEQAMISDEIGKQLHDRATRGEVLTAEEQSQLSKWYAAQDQIENDLLNASNPVASTSELQKRIDPSKKTSFENDALRDGIAELCKRKSLYLD